jgi:hypothetical protein
MTIFVASHLCRHHLVDGTVVDVASKLMMIQEHSKFQSRSSYLNNISSAKKEVRKNY